jgi:hypothetical protein
VSIGPPIKVRLDKTKVNRADRDFKVIAAVETALCGKCGWKLGWIVDLLGDPPTRIALRPPGWRREGAVWCYGRRPRARRAGFSNHSDYNKDEIRVTMPTALLCPRCGQQQTLN